MEEKVRVLILFHSVTGNVMALARAAARGAEDGGAEAVIKRVPETIPPEVLEKNARHMKVKAELDAFPVATVEELPDYDGLLVGTPTRFGNMSAQMKSFLDRTGSLWGSGVLSGKPFALFQSNEMPHGGKEATLLSMIPVFLAHGMILVGFPNDKRLYAAGSFYGATATGTPKEADLELAALLAARLARAAAHLQGFS